MSKYRGQDAAIFIHRNILEALPDLGQAIAETRQELFAFNVTTSTNRQRGIGILLVQAINDFSDLLADIAMGRGRPAMRCLRTVFESLITMKDITNPNSNDLQRYEDFFAVASYQEAIMEVGMSGLVGKRLRAERHRKHKEERKHKKAHDEAIAKWGKGFKHNWTNRTFRQRAAKHGFSEEYKIYRLASSIVHVSSGGMSGIEREYDELNVHRFGPNLIDCPLAFSEGLRLFETFIEGIANYTGVSADRVNQSLAKLKLLQVDYREYITRLDQSLWPKEPPFGHMVVRALLPNGERKWIIHDQTQQRIIECHPPKAVTSLQLKNAEASLNEWEALHPVRPDWITSALLGATSVPLTDANWRSEEIITPFEWNANKLLLPWDK